MSYRFWMPILLLTAFTGCYTQLRVPEASGLPPSVREEPASRPPRFDVYHPSPFSPYRCYDPWDCARCDPYTSWWSARMTFRYDPFGLYYPWRMGYPTAIFLPLSVRHYPFPPVQTTTPDTIFSAAQRPRMRRIGFGPEIPSAAAMRGIVERSQARSGPAAEDWRALIFRTWQAQHGAGAPAPEEEREEAQKRPRRRDGVAPKASGSRVRPRQSRDDSQTSESRVQSPSKRDSEGSGEKREEKREEKRKERRRRGGMK